LTLVGRKTDAPSVAARLRTLGEPLGLVEVDPELSDVLRVEAGTPCFGRDVTAENLPQEVGRDQRAISFVKGCYLGQETVARIDALGHVNKLLKGLKFLTPGAATTADATLMLDGKTVGKITSAALSPAWGVPVALGYVRLAHAEAGTELLCMEEGEPRRVVVCDLPMLPFNAADASIP
jgi:folate-binding protein YgfZ